MKVLVTGGSGFIGKHVTRRLSALDHEHINIDRKHLFTPIDLRSITPALIEGCDAIIHLAALADVRSNWMETGEDPRIWRDNMEALHSLLRAAACARSVKSFVFVSTGALWAYPLSPYGASKLAGEAYCRSYAEHCNWKLTIARPAACFGEGYTHGHVADFVDQAKRNGRIECLTAGLPRHAAHVVDVANVLVRFATELGGVGDVFYLRSQHLWSCRDTAEMIGVPTTFTSKTTGWSGDGGAAPWDEPTIILGRHPSLGVYDAIRSLGWDPK